MPYYVYALQPGAQLEKIAEHAAFPTASSQAKRLRAELPPKSLARIRVVFAETELQAEDLLLQVRDPQHAGEE